MTFTGLDVPQEASSSVNTIEEPPSRKVPLVAAVAASGRHGFRKEVCRAITLVEGFGVEGDAHGGATVQHLYLGRGRFATRPGDTACHQASLFGRTIMEWFNQKTSIAGIQVSNWMIALGAIIVILLAYSFMR